MDVSYNKGDIEFAKILLLKWNLLGNLQELSIFFSVIRTTTKESKTHHFPDLYVCV